MTEVEPPKRRAIIGVGNVLMSDEGVGVHAARMLADRDVDPGVLVLDGGTEGLGLMDVVDGLERLVIVDCVRAGGEPGAVYRFDWGDAAAPRPVPLSSLHQVSVDDVLRHVALVGRVPATTILGIEPCRLEMGLTLSDVVAQRLAGVCEMALREVSAPRS